MTPRYTSLRYRIANSLALRAQNYTREERKALLGLAAMFGYRFKASKRRIKTYA